MIGIHLIRLMEVEHAFVVIFFVFVFVFVFHMAPYNKFVCALLYYAFADFKCLTFSIPFYLYFFSVYILFAIRLAIVYGSLVISSHPLNMFRI
jgi:hypothetical protein